MQAARFTATIEALGMVVGGYAPLAVVRRLAVVLLLFSTFGGAAAATTDTLEPTIYVSNESQLSDDLVEATLPAFQAAIDEDFAPAWKADATLQFLRGSQQPPPGAWQIVLGTETDVGAVAYHSRSDGVPIAHVYVASAIEAGDSWEALFSHELFEMLTDPQVSRAAWDGAHKVRLLEVCDPVERLDFAYKRADALGRPVQISDFVLPSWFDATSDAPYDFTGHAHHPGHVLPGGFTNVWRNGWWHEVDGPESLPTSNDVRHYLASR